MLSPNTILQNRYRIVRELGHGGMGTVYEAVDQRVNCIVALKETTAGNDAEAKRAFEREASLLANLRHSTLPKVMDYFTEGDGDFLVMEFIPGYDLAELLESRESAFPQSQVLRWAFELLRVLEYLHKQEPPILHRDIKPSNLKLTKNGEVFLLDFGLAKGALGQMPTLAASRSVRGYTPIYASLEQIHGHGTDPRSDLYSLGATLYHLLSGMPPVDAPTRFHVVEDGDPDPLKPIQKVNAEASPNVAAVIHQAMALSRKDRPINASEMSKALRNAAEEDERNAAEEEYRRAEQRRLQRDEERRRAEEEAARRAEEERRQQEAETRKREEEARRAKEREREEKKRRADEAGRKRAEEERHGAEAAQRRQEEELKRERKRAEEKRQRAEAEERRSEEERKHSDQEARSAGLAVTVPGPTVPAGELRRKKEAPTPEIKTIPAPAPERVSADVLKARVTHPESQWTSDGGQRRNLFMVAGITTSGIVLVVILILAFGLTKPTDQSAKNTPTTSSSSPATGPNAAPTGMVYVPGGTFMMGRDDGDEYERPAHQVTVKPFFIDIYEITNADYDKFVKATNHEIPQTWINGTYRAAEIRKPVTGVTWDDADAYCRWMKKELPTEEQWEFAARGSDGRKYPWGNDWRTGLANANRAQTSMAEVGEYKGTSPVDAYDMVGNAWEWTSSDMVAYPEGKLPEQPANDTRVLRGGSFQSDKDQATVTYRFGWRAHEEKSYTETGFRCAQDFK